MLTDVGHCHIAQGQRAVTVLGEGEGDLCIAGNKQLLGAAFDEGAGGVGAVGLAHIPLGIALGLQEDVGVRLEGGIELAANELVGAHVLIVFLAAVVRTVDVAHQIVGLLEVGVGAAADGAGAVYKAVTQSRDGSSVDVTAQTAGKGLDTGLVTGGLGGDCFAVLMAAALGANLILVQLQVGNVAAGGAGVGTELRGADLHVDATAGSCVGEDEAIGDRPCRGSVSKLKVGAGVVGQILAIHAQRNAAVYHFHSPDRQVVAGDDPAVHGDTNTGELTAGKGGAHSEAAVLGNDHVLAVGDAAQVGDQHEAGIGDGIVGIQCAADGAAAAGELVAGGGDALGVAVAALGAGVGLHAGLGTGGGCGDLGGVAVLAGSGNRLIAQGHGAVLVLDHGEGHVGVAGDKELVGSRQGGAVIQGGGSDFALPAIGHVPADHLGTKLGTGVHFLDAHVGVGLEVGGELAVCKQVLAQIGSIFLTAVVGVVDVAKQIVYIGSVVGILCTADGADAQRVSMLDRSATGGAGAVGVVRHVLAVGGIHGVADGQVAIPVLGQGEVEGLTAGNQQLVGAGRVGIGKLVEGCGGGGADPAVGHVVGGIVAGLDGHVAVLGELGGELAIFKLVGAQIGLIIADAVVSAVDVAKQVVAPVVAGIGSAAEGAGAVFIDVAAALRSDLVLVQLQIQHIAVGRAGGSVSAELGGTQLHIDATTCGGGSQTEAICHRPGVGGICQLEVGTGVVGQIGGAVVQGDAAVYHFHGPDGQAVAGDDLAVHSDTNTGQLAAGKGGAHGEAAVLGNDDVLAVGDLAQVGDQHKAGVGDGVVGIQCAADSAGTLVIAVTGGSRLIPCIDVAAVGAGVGGVTLFGAGGRRDHGLVAVTDGVHRIGVQAVLATGRALMTGVAVVFTGGRHHDVHIAVAGGGDLLGVHVTALGAGVGLDTGLGAGGCHSNLGGVAMGTVGIHLAADGTLTVFIAVAVGRDHLGVAVATGGAGEGLDTAFGTGGGGGDLFGVAVTLGAQNGGVLVATLGAGVDILALCGAGGLHSFGNLVVMAAVRRRGLIAQPQSAVGVLAEGEGHFHVAGDKHLLAPAFLEAADGVGAVGLCHKPLAVALCLDKDVGVGGEVHGELTVHELVGAHIQIVILTTHIGAVDEAHQIIGGFRLGVGIPVFVRAKQVAAIGGDGQVAGLAAAAVVENNIHGIGGDFTGIKAAFHVGHGSAGPLTGKITGIAPGIDVDGAPVFTGVVKIDGACTGGGCAQRHSRHKGHQHRHAQQQ